MPNQARFVNLNNLPLIQKTISLKPLTILIVDDHTLIRDSWISLLPQSNPNFSVIGSTGDGNAATDIAEHRHPDIILLDINMHPLDGFETLKAIRKVAPASRVIAVSMNAMPVYAKKMMHLGANGYITKTSSITEMVNAIEIVASGGKYFCTEIKNNLVEEAFCEDENDPSKKINLLTKRELEVVQLVTKGLSSRDIAESQQITLKTVEVHRYKVLKKLKLKNTASLVQFMNTYGLN